MVLKIKVMLSDDLSIVIAASCSTHLSQAI